MAQRAIRLPDRVSFYLLASIVLFFLAGSSAPTPLYAVYQAEWGFSPITVTVVFGIYALAVLAALLVFGRLSDHVGRRPVLLTALVLQAATMILFSAASGVSELLVARVLQGLSTGAAVGAIGAGMLDFDRARGTIANAVAPVTGTATGALGASLLVQFLPAPTHVVYLVLFGVFVLQFAGVLLMRETSAAEPGAVASMRPEFSVPPAVRRPVLVAIPALVAVWSLAGFYGSLGPALVRLVTGSRSYVLGGLALAVLAGAGALTVLALRNAAPRMVMMLGTATLATGVAGTLLATRWSSAALLFIGTAVAGVGFGAAFQGALRTVLPLARPHQRAGVLSTLYVVSYLAMGVPAVIGGYLVVHGGGVLATAREYGLAVIVLALLALLGVALPGRSTARHAAPAAERELVKV
jgi:predicted MFS family arabinose efflux permease